MRLRNQIKEMKVRLLNKELEVVELKKSMKFTKVQELEVNKNPVISMLTILRARLRYFQMKRIS